LRERFPDLPIYQLKRKDLCSRLGHGDDGGWNQAEHFQRLLVIVLGEQFARKSGHQGKGRLDAGLHLNEHTHSGQLLLYVEGLLKRGAVM